MKALLDLVRVNAKAIVAALASVVLAVFGFDIPVDVQLAVATILVFFLTWLVPNKK